MARKAGINGWHGMRKEELIRAILLTTRLQVSKDRVSGDRHRAQATRPSRKRPVAKQISASGRRSSSNSIVSGKTTVSGSSAASGTSTVSNQNPLRKGPESKPKSRPQLNHLLHKLAAVKNLAAKTANNSSCSDRLVVMVRDPYWLHANWELSQRSVQRARVALGGKWFQAQPMLRLFQVDEESSSTLMRNIPIHGGVNHWYIDVQDPPLNYRLEIGYQAADESYYCLARSNTVSTPPAGTSDAVDRNWADVAEHADRIYAMSGGYSADGTSRELQELLEERLNRPLGSPMKTRFGRGATSGPAKSMEFAVDAEVIVYGAVDHGAHVTLKGEPIALHSDGTFTVRISMPNRRQVIPIVASSADGTLQRTISMIVERNTKTLELVHRDLTK